MFFLAKVVVFGQNGCIRKIGSIRAKVVIVGQSGCIRGIVVVFGQYWLYSGKRLYSRQKLLYSGKVVVLGNEVGFI